jgi:hypothetical protein
MAVNALTSPTDVAEAIAGVGARTGLGTDIVASAVASSADSVPRLGMSGWLASGKDTVAEGVFERLGVTAAHLSFGAALKNELNHVLELVHAASDERDARTRAQDFLAATGEQIEILFDAMLPGDFYAARERLVGLDARSRTPEVRAALQKLGTDIRRAQDDLYWVNQGLSAAIIEMAAGRPLYFTDCRFANEAAGLQSIGIPVVRLEVSRDVQASRLFARDGLELDPVATSHPSETGLDDWDGFALVVDNNGTTDDAVRAVLAHMDWVA